MAAERADPTYGYADLADPCSGCAAHCCTAVVFPHAIPTTRPGLDYLRFCLGFPGIEVGVGDDTWSAPGGHPVLGVRDRGAAAAVRVLRRGPLLVPGPLRAGPARGVPAGHARGVPALSECFRFDELGNTVELMLADDIREHIEAGWRAPR